MQDLWDQIAAVARELALAHFEAPPVEPLVLALHYGIPIVPSDGAALWHTDADQPCLHYDRREFPLRARFTVAHELLEILSSQGLIDFAVPAELARQSEALYQHGAAELLLPGPLLAAEGPAADWDLSYLQRAFRVSWEALGRQVLQHLEAVLTIVDNGALYCRLNSPGLRAPTLLDPVERSAVDQVYAAWPCPEPRRAAGPQFRVRAWPAWPERQGVRRVVALTQPREGD